MVGAHDPVEVLRGDVPETVRRAVVIARRQKPRGETLDRAVDDDLHDAEMQAVGVRRGEAADLGDAVLRRAGDGGQRRHDPHRQTRDAGGSVNRHGRVREVVVQVGDGGDALELRGRAEPGHVVRIQGPAHRVVAEPPEQAQPRGDALQLAGRGAVRQLRHAVDGRGGVEARHLQKQAVDVGDVQAGVVDHHRPGCGDPVEVVPGQARAAEMQRVEAPAVEQLVRVGDGPGGLRKPGHDGARWSPRPGTRRPSGLRRSPAPT